MKSGVQTEAFIFSQQGEQFGFVRNIQSIANRNQDRRVEFGVDEELSGKLDSVDFERQKKKKKKKKDRQKQFSTIFWKMTNGMRKIQTIKQQSKHRSSIACVKQTIYSNLINLSSEISPVKYLVLGKQQHLHGSLRLN